MAGGKEKDRFLFFKYIPPRKGEIPFKDKEYDVSGEEAEPVGEMSDFEQGINPDTPIEAEIPAEGEKPEHKGSLTEEENGEPEIDEESGEELIGDEVTEEEVTEEEVTEEEVTEEEPVEEYYEEEISQDQDSVSETEDSTSGEVSGDSEWLPGIPDFPECPEPPEIPEYPEPPGVPEGPCPENAVIHVIQAGDTFWKLSKKYGTTVEAITEANPDADPLNLQIGETICIPGGIPGAKG